MAEERKAIGNPKVISYSKIFALLLCAWRAFKQFVKPDGSAKITASMDYGLRIHGFAEEIGAMVKAEEEDVRNIMKGQSEQETQHGIRYAEWCYEKDNVVNPEFQGTIQLRDGFTFEFHIDRILIDEYGNVYIIDIKTSPLIKSKKDAQKDMQLQLYAWAFLRWMKEFRSEKLKDFKQVYIGWYNWKNDNSIIAEYDPSVDYEEAVIELAERMQSEDPEKYPQTVNEYCSDCPFINECIPDKIPQSYAGISAEIKRLTAQLEIKKAHMIKKCNDLGVETLPADDSDPDKENKEYKMCKRTDTAADVNDFLSQVGNDIEKIKPHIRLSKELLEEQGLKVKTTVTGMPVWFALRRKVKPKKKKKP